MRKAVLHTSIYAAAVLTTVPSQAADSQAGGLPALADRVSVIESVVSSVQTTLGSTQALVTSLQAKVASLEAANSALQAALSSEVAARAGADTALQSNIQAENLARVAADIALQTAITAQSTDVRVRTASADVHTLISHSESAHCLVGEIVTGGGMLVSPVGGQYDAYPSFPIKDGGTASEGVAANGWFGRVYNFGSETVQMTVYALCAVP